MARGAARSAPASLSAAAGVPCRRWPGRSAAPRGPLPREVCSGGFPGRFRGLRLDASPPLPISPTDNNQAELVTYPDDDYLRIEPGFTLAGPIVLGRAWLVAGYWRALETTNRTVTFLTNGETRTSNRKDRTHSAALKLSLRLGAATRARDSSVPSRGDAARARSAIRSSEGWADRDPLSDGCLPEARIPARRLSTAG